MADSKTGHHSIIARQKRQNATTARKYGITHEYAVENRTTKQEKGRHNMDDIASEKDDEESEPEEIQQITQINKIIPDNNDHYGVEININGKKQKFIIDTGSPVTIMPNDITLYKAEDIQPLKERYQDVNKTEIKFLGKVWSNIENNNTQTNLPLLITKRTDITPLKGVNWLKQLPITINGISLNKENNQSETAIHTKFKKLFETNHTIKNIEVKIQIKPGCYPIQQKSRPIRYHLQDDVKNELDD